MAAKNELAVVARMKDEVSKGFTRIGKSVTKFARTAMTKVTGVIKSILSLKTAVLGLGAAFAGKMLAGFVASTATLYDKTAKLAGSLGVTSRSLMEMQHAANLSGLNFSELESAMKAYTKAAGDAGRGVALQAEAFKQLGISVEEVTAGKIDMTDLFTKVSDGLKRLGTDTERARVLMDLFGRSGNKLLVLFKSGKLGIKEMAAEARRLGIAVDESTLKISEDFIDARTRFEGALRGIKNAFLNDLYPILTRALNNLAEYFAKNRGTIVQYMKDIAVTIINALGGIAKAVLHAGDVYVKAARLIGKNAYEDQVIVKAHRENLGYLEHVQKRLKAAQEELKGITRDAEFGAAIPLERFEKLRGVIPKYQAEIESLNAAIKASGKDIDAPYWRQRDAIDSAMGKLKNLLSLTKQAQEATSPGGGGGRPWFDDPKYDYRPEDPLANAGDQGALVDWDKHIEEHNRKIREGWSDLEKMGKGAAQGLENYIAKVPDLFTAAAEASETLLLGIEDRLSQGLLSIVDGSKKAKDAFRDMALDILKLIGQIIIKLLVMKAIQGGLGGLGFTAASGGGAPAPESGPSMASGSSGADLPAGVGGSAYSKTGGGGPTTVNITILANDTQDFDRLLTKRRRLLEDIFINALQTRRAVVQAVRPTGGGSGKFDGWQELLTVPAARFAGGHTYVLILTGLIGAFDGVSCTPGQVFRAELSLRRGTATYYQNIEQMVHPLDGLYGTTAMWGARTAGYPFQLMVEYVCPATPDDLHVIGRFYHDPSLTRHKDVDWYGFHVEQLMVTAWDKDTLGTTGTPCYQLSSYTTPAFDLAKAPVNVNTITHANGGYWMVYHGAYCTPFAGGAPDGCSAYLYCDQVPHYLFPDQILTTFCPIGLSTIHTNRLWMGQQRLAVLPDNWTLRQYVYDDGPSPGKCWRAMLFAVRIDPDMDPFLLEGAPSSAGGFYRREHEGDWFAGRFTTAGVAQKKAVFFSTTYASRDIGCRNILDIDSGQVSFQEMGAKRPLLAGQQGLPMVVGGEFPLGEGTHHVLGRGATTYRDVVNLVFQGQVELAKDPWVYGFDMSIDDSPPANPEPEIPGPEVDVVPSRETGLAVGSLSPLPYEPSLPLSCRVETEVRALEFPSGHQVSHPKFLKMRRVFDLTWNGLTTEEADDLVGFFRDLAGAAFRWQPPGDLEEKAWALDPSSYGREGSNKVTATVVELVFTA